MRLELTGRHIEISPVLRRLVERKLARLERILKDAVVSAQVVLTREKHTRRADVTLHARGEKFLHGIGATGQWETSMTAAVDKIAQQAQRVKGKWQERKRRGTRAASRPTREGAERAGAVTRTRPLLRMPRILRASRQAVKAMSLADAAREMEANGEGVFVFRDAETFTISVIYRRSTGELTLVETEA